MEKVKSILILFAAIVLTICMVVPVFAAGEGTITISKAVEGQTYNAYRIFDLESYVAGSAYAYKVNSAWTGFFAEGKEGLNYVTIDDAGYVTWNGQADAAEFAKKALAYAEENSIAPTGTTEATKVDDTVSAKITGIDLGYYLVDSSVGTLCSLDTTEPTVEIQEKNEGSTIEHKVEVTTGTYNTTNTATIGDNVNYKVTINAKEGAEGYVLDTKLSEGLTYKAVTEVKLGDTTVAAENYAVTAPATDGDSFEVEFKQEFLDTLTDTSVIEVYYTATLNENAAIGNGVGNTSTVTLTYGENNDLEAETTAEITAKTFTYEFDLVKTDSSDIVITGAQFKLYDAETGGNEIKVVKLSDGLYRVAVAGEEGVVIDAGTATIRGLGNGTYYLNEETAPSGYNKLTARQPVTIASDNNKASTEASGDDTKYTTGGVQIINKTGAELPETGGIGTTILYIVGGSLMFVAGVMIVARKRMSGVQR